MQTEYSQLAETLEGLVDASSLNSVLAALTIICCEKAEHINNNWQDRALASKWTRLAVALERSTRLAVGNKL